MKIFTEHTNNESKGSLDISLMIFYMGREFTLRYVDERDKRGLDLAECNWNQHAKQILLPQLYSTVEFKVTLIKSFYGVLLGKVVIQKTRGVFQTCNGN